LIEGKKVFEGLTGARQSLENGFGMDNRIAQGTGQIAKGFRTDSGVADVDRNFENLYRSPEFETQFKASYSAPEENKLIEQEAERMQMTPERLKQEMFNYIEPPKSQ